MDGCLSIRKPKATLTYIGMKTITFTRIQTVVVCIVCLTVLMTFMYTLVTLRYHGNTTWPSNVSDTSVGRYVASSTHRSHNRTMPVYSTTGRGSNATNENTRLQNTTTTSKYLDYDPGIIGEEWGPNLGSLIKRQFR